MYLHNINYAVTKIEMFLSYSGLTQNTLFWSWGRLQCHGHRPPGTKSRRFIRVLPPKILFENCTNAGNINAIKDRIRTLEWFLAPRYQTR